MTAAHQLPRLLRGVQDGGTLTLARHLRVHGPLPAPERGAGPQLLDLVERSGLRGHGGAHVSTALKLRAVASRRRRAIVVANGSESEPASAKDATLLARAPASAPGPRSPPPSPSAVARAAGNPPCGWWPRRPATSAARRRR